MSSWKQISACAAGAIVIAACGGGSGGGGGIAFIPSATAPAADQPPAASKISLQVLSSQPEYVSGGDARIAVNAPQADQGQLELWLNGEKISPALAASATRLEGLVAGLKLGANTLEVRHKTRGKLDALTLTNYPITGPMFAGPKQEPFVCSVLTDLGKEPLVDTDDSKYYAVKDKNGNTIGYSRHCSIDSYVQYYYMPVGGTSHNQYLPMPTDGSRPGNIAKTRLTDGREVDFIVRWERGTINRFIYQYVMLAPFGEDPARPDTSLWNKKLVYHFQGGVGFGHYQGGPDKRAGLVDAIGKGYAIAYSTGNRTGEHYDMILGGETALMTKEGFVKRYGVPSYTVGLGASGGGIQQYLYPQNHPGLIDAAIAVQPYPDMVGQIPHVGDCELLEYYMDVTDRANAKWTASIKNRTWLVGFNAEETVANPFYGLQPYLPNVRMATGSTECRKAWMGLTAGAMNPKFDADSIMAKGAARMNMAAFGPIPFSHYDDVRNVYGIGADGYPRSTWDNVGVQYGLQSMKDGKISTAEFLDLNLKVGGWKRMSEMVAEGFPYNGTGNAEVMKVAADASYFDPWGSRNMNRWNPLTPDVPALRTHGDLDAIKAMQRSGLVFTGKTDIPTIDWHPYLEQQLNMHNVHQSFAIRKRIRNKMGNSDHQAIWFTETRNAAVEFDQTPMAFEVIDEWMTKIRANPQRSVADNRPDRAVDSCFDNTGALMARGADVWSGVLDTKPKGACTQAFPMYGTSRIVAGGPIEGGIFKCALKPLDNALADGTYGTWKPNAAEIQKLQAIFPEGVCDFASPGQGSAG
ncbi:MULTISPECIES: DUF6351 family protein [Variovorax]|jgi:hypothetical protein|uniref:DUF6351 family protein n=1 Tax=Variovorax TaxID=34072 RepID=UPI00086BD33D|nr:MULTISPECIES: DUF6351 family protein [Variovorax]MBN8753711.1 hypothetical protein [Variovorax sp.]ODU17275.1 MAG: hypothetical protein ABS94_09650 [Variovorax sp. SCN 67-85]ODV24347.1 MAG: hypothetical protein ABT25_15050 [Variovorax sp. SCN 67-20]OJZ02652.1 MAG: hypothetical protein BGP22_19755 [Variovorax sp. 67-131]UKI10877.1 DUF6351 family protein [Variovorax paradoxus]